MLKRKNRQKQSDVAGMTHATTSQNVAAKKSVRKRIVVITTTACLLAVSGGFAYWRFVVWQPAVVNPFSPSILAAAGTPLYYPTRLPIGYRIDTKSVSEPQAGVTVLTLDGPKGQKIFMSEEARPTKYDIGGFYLTFKDLKETTTSDGSIASGFINNGKTRIASRLNNKTWTLTNTGATGVSPAQLAAMLESLTLSY